jgi:serine/threonine protein kinase
MAPEYINRGIITTKSDIFSLGVIIIEIITGQRNYPWPSSTGTSYHDFIELVSYAFQHSRWRLFVTETMVCFIFA